MRRSRAASRVSPETRALQTALAAEQAAIYGYGVAGSHLSGAARARATTWWLSHQVAADKLTAMLQSRRARPDPAAVAYQLPQQVAGAAQAVSLAATLEDQVTSAYLGLVALPAQSVRMLGAGQARIAALRAAAWHGSTQAFPGLSASALADQPGHR